MRDKAMVIGRWHDNSRTLVAELAESGAGDEVVMSIAGRVSRAMLSRYSRVRMETKRRALDEIAASAKPPRSARPYPNFPILPPLGPQNPPSASRMTKEELPRASGPRRATALV